MNDNSFHIPSDGAGWIRDNVRSLSFLKQEHDTEETDDSHVSEYTLLIAMLTATAEQLNGALDQIQVLNSRCGMFENQIERLENRLAKQSDRINNIEDMNVAKKSE